jgi:hypothetical protein
MRKGENIFLACTILVGAVIFFGSMNVPSYEIEPLKPGMYAMIISGLLVFVCALKLFFNFKEHRANAVKDDRPVVVGHPVIIISQAVMMVVYVFGMTHIGFFTTTFFYLTITLCMLTSTKDIKGIVKYSAGSLAFTAVLYFIFDKFYVYLPNTRFF